MIATRVLHIRPMTEEDLPFVQLIEGASFTTPWPPHAYRQELSPTASRTTSLR